MLVIVCDIGNGATLYIHWDISIALMSKRLLHQAKVMLRQVPLSSLSSADSVDISRSSCVKTRDKSALGAQRNKERRGQEGHPSLWNIHLPPPTLPGPARTAVPLFPKSGAVWSWSASERTKRRGKVGWVTGMVVLRGREVVVVGGHSHMGTVSGRPRQRPQRDDSGLWMEPIVWRGRRAEGCDGEWCGSMFSFVAVLLCVWFFSFPLISFHLISQGPLEDI